MAILYMSVHPLAHCLTLSFYSMELLNVTLKLTAGSFYFLMFSWSSHCLHSPKTCRLCKLDTPNILATSECLFV